VVEALLILDGASEPLEGETSLEAARTPVLDRLAAEGRLSAVRTVPPGLPVGSETAIPGLLGWTPPAAVDRGALEAAALGLELHEGERAWRVDVLGHEGLRMDDVVAERAAADLAVRLPRYTVRRLRGHRLLVTGPSPLAGLGRGEGLGAAMADRARVGSPEVAGAELWVWPEGVVPPRILDERTVMVAAAGAAAGAARLLGAAVVVPPGATGGVDTDLGAKAAAAEQAIAEGAERVVVHVGAPDEASHVGDRAAKVEALERIDAELTLRLAEAVAAAGGTLRVCPDHGCDPRSGEHCADPVPCLDWSPEPTRGSFRSRDDHKEPRVVGVRLTERCVVPFSPPGTKRNHELGVAA
jgi:2,3-bisphosphoglycerate-independent phosphoglycerate mutase